MNISKQLRNAINVVVKKPFALYSLTAIAIVVCSGLIASYGYEAKSFQEWLVDHTRAQVVKVLQK